MTQVNIPWTTKAREEIAACEIKVAEYLNSYTQLINTAYDIGPTENYPEYEKYITLARDELHKYGLEQYRLRALKYDLHYDLGHYEVDDNFSDEQDSSEQEMEYPNE